MRFLAIIAPKFPGRIRLVRGKVLLGEGRARANRANSSEDPRSSKVAVVGKAKRLAVTNAESVESRSPNIPIIDGALLSSSKDSSRREIGKGKEELSNLLRKALASCSM